MTSNISAAYAALDATTVTFTLLGQSRTPVVKTLSEIPNTINAGDLPLRLLLSMESVGDGERMDFLTIGAGASGGSFHMRWKITDLMLAIPSAQGQGIKSVAASLVSYCGKYADMARNSRNLATGISIEHLTLAAGTYTYPGEAGTPYFGVQATLDLVEIVS